MMTDEESMWRAVMSRDAAQAGVFFYGVMTTGVFCRPGCSARRPLRKNVRFYDSAQEAERDGLRACLRCRPTSGQDAPANDTIAEIRRFIRKHAHQISLVTLDALSRRFQMSPYHLQRTFKAVVGVTPKKFAKEIQMQTLKEDLRQGARVTEAMYSAGFGSSSRLYEEARAQLGMTPKQYRDRGRGVEISYATLPTPLGLVMVGATDRGLCYLQFGTTEEELLEFLQQEYSEADISRMPNPPSEQYQNWLRSLGRYLSGERALGRLPLALHGTAFQIKVWQYLQTIPSGEVQSYTEVAKGIGQPSAVRAVASACAANQIAIVVPCHRVIRGDGSLGGYRWGLDRKRTLLDLERGPARKAGLARRGSGGSPARV